jgi:hypothetical protein
MLCLAPLAGLAWAQAEKGATEMPVTKVVLFTSGVGYFERSGQVEPGSRVELMFKTEDINDILKSMVITGAEQVSVTYASRDPVTKALKSFAVDITGNPTLGELLNQLRGARVEVSVPQTFSGVILGVEKRTKILGENQTVTIDVLNVMTDQGLRSVELPSVTGIRLLDADLEKELGRALAALAAARDRNKKPVTITFGVKDKREVAVSYIAETPVWKTRYGLVLSEKGKPFLQGWAIVENTTDSDWKDVNLSLVSGQPISFVMDLYTPLYSPRPLVMPELYASLRPQAYEAELEVAPTEGMFRGAPPAAAPAAARKAAEQRSEMALADAAKPQGAAYGADRGRAREDLSLGNAVRQLQAAVQKASAVAELFEYPIAGKVSLERQKSAMFLIVAGDIEAERLSIFDETTHPKFPLNGLDLTNSTGVYLMQGPITVFDGGTYAGDARISPDIPVGDKRLISYSLDQKREVAVTAPSRPDEIVSLRIVRGTLIVTRKYQREKSYTINNKEEKERTVLVQYPYDSDWQLVEPKGEKPATANLYRFRAKVSAKKAGQNGVERLTVVEERSDPQHIALTNVTPDTITIYLRSKKASQAVMDALQDIIKQKNEIALLQRQIDDKKGEVSQISDDQARIRQNMRELDRTSTTYTNYVKKLDEQEMQLEKLRGEIKALEDQVRDKKKALDESILKLNVE